MELATKNVEEFTVLNKHDMSFTARLTTAD